MFILYYFSKEKVLKIKLEFLALKINNPFLCAVFDSNFLHIYLLIILLVFACYILFDIVLFNLQVSHKGNKKEAQRRLFSNSLYHNFFDYFLSWDKNLLTSDSFFLLVGIFGEKLLSFWNQFFIFSFYILYFILGGNFLIFYIGFWCLKVYQNGVKSVPEWGWNLVKT